MKRFFVAFVLALFMLLSAGAVDNIDRNNHFSEKLFDGKSLCDYVGIEEIPDVSGHSAYVYNVETGSVIYRKNQDDIVYPASTVKLMTAIVAYENIEDLQTVITASKSAYNATKGSNMAVKIGEQFTAEQLLYGLLVTGANDAANVLAEYVAGDIASFCQMMNKKAKEIGCTNTHFANPTGLHSDDMVTTAKDTAIIANYFFSLDEIFQMSNTTRYTIESTPFTKQQRILLNRNYLISRVRSEDYYYPKAMGMSLGSTPEAGDCIVTSATDDSGMTYICVVMSAHSTDDKNKACIDATNLLKMSLEKFKYTGVLTSKTIICEIPVKLAVDTDYITLLPSGNLSALLPSDFNYERDISVEPRISHDYVAAPIKEGEAYGEAVVKYKDEIILGSVSLVSGRTVDRSNVLYLLDRAEQMVLGRWFRLFLIFSAVFLALYFFASVMFVSKRRRRRFFR